MGKKICIPTGELAYDDDKKKAKREALKQRLLKDGKVAFKEESYHIESKDETLSIEIPKGVLELKSDDFQQESDESKNEGAFTPIDDGWLNAKREELRQKLINGGKVELRKPEIASDDVTPDVTNDDVLKAAKREALNKWLINDEGKVELRKPEIASDDVTPDVTNDDVLKAKREALKEKLINGGGRKFRSSIYSIYIPDRINYGFAYVRSSSLIRDTFIGDIMAHDMWSWMANKMQDLVLNITKEDVCDLFFWYKIFVDHLQMEYYEYYEIKGLKIPGGLTYETDYFPKIGRNSYLKETYLGDVRVDDLCNWIAEIMRDITQKYYINQIVSSGFWQDIFNNHLFAKYEKEHSS